VVKFM